MGAWHPPVAIRAKAWPPYFSGAWHPHARHGETGSATVTAAGSATEAANGNPNRPVNLFLAVSLWEM